MNKIKDFFFGKCSSYAYSIFTVLLAIIPEKCFYYGFFYVDWDNSIIVFINRIYLFLLVFAIVTVIYKLYQKKRNYVFIKEKTFIIQIEYGNIIKINKGKKVINFDECFTTTIGDNPCDIKRDSICGQYLSEHPDLNIQNLMAYNNTTLYYKKDVVL